MKTILSTVILMFGAVAFVSMSTQAEAEDYVALRCVMETHPDWPTVTDEDLVIWLNIDSISYRPTNAPSRDIWDVIILKTDYDTLADVDRDLVRTTLFGAGNQEVDISDNTTPTSVVLIRVFTGTTTLPALNNAFTYQQSPCDSIGWGPDCHLGDVQNAQLVACVVE